MNSSWKTALCLGAVLAGPAAALAAAPQRALSEAERAVLRTDAQTRLLDMIERRSVRPGDPAVDAASARRLAAALDDAQLLAVFGGEDPARVLAGEEAGAEVSAEELVAAVEKAIGDATSDLLFVPLPPCRIVDTRLADGGALDANETRDFQVNGITEFLPQGGTQGGCGVPPGALPPEAPAVVLNFIAVGPQGPGDLRAWAFGQPVPNASVINYSNVAGLNVANGVIVPVAGTTTVPADLSVRADVSGTHVVIDVTGYFTRFPVEQFEAAAKSITVSTTGGAVDLSSGACTEVNSCTITSTSTGKVIVRTWSQVTINHTQGSPGGDRIAVGVKNTQPTLCTNNDQSINATDFEVPEPQGTDNGVETTLAHKRIFAQTPGTRTYFINARMVTGASAGDAIQSSRMVCTFIPD